MTATLIPTERRFWEKVQKTDTCWLWTGGTDRKGYGKFWLDGQMRMAHRVSYEMNVGPIPPGMTIDHVRDRGCTSKACVNPAHLEAVTMQVNQLRGTGMGALNAAKTHCSRGHRYTKANTRIYRGRRYCRTCRSDYDRRRIRTGLRRAP